MFSLDFNGICNEWWLAGMETAREDREEAQGRALQIWGLLLFLLLACWVPPISQGTLLPCSISSCRKMRRGGTSKYLPWGRKAPGFPYLLNVLLTIDFFGVPYILSSPSSFLLSCLSRNGYWVIEQLTNTKFQLGVKISSLARTTLSSLLFWPLQFSTCHWSANTGFSPYTLTFSFHFYPIIW